MLFLTCENNYNGGTMKVYFHMCHYLFAAYFQKMLSFEMHFIKNSVSACFPTFIQTYPRKKQTFYSVFGFVIAEACIGGYRISHIP